MKYFIVENLSKIIVKLIKDTRAGTLKWDDDSTYVESGEDRIIGKPYSATLNGQILRIYKYRHKHYTDFDQFNWSESYRIEFIDVEGNSEWIFPNTSSIGDL